MKLRTYLAATENIKFVVCAQMTKFPALPELSSHPAAPSSPGRAPAAERAAIRAIQTTRWLE